VPDRFSLTEFLRGNPIRAKILFFFLGAGMVLSFAPFGLYLLAPLLLLPLLYGTAS
jgi:apolipoprotein N-acyltransferase